MRLLACASLPALVVVVGTLALGGPAKADTPAFVQIGGPGTRVIRPITLHVRWDSSPPQVTGLRVNLQAGRQIVRGSIPLVTTWTPSSTAPLAGTVLERLVGAGAYSPIYRGSARARFLRVAPQRRYGLRVRASDIAGLQSGWATRPAFVSRLIDDRDPRILWSPGWKRVTDPTAVGGSLRCAGRYGRWADLQVRWGSDLGFVSPEGRQYGTAAIALRGSRTPSATVTLTRPASRPRTLAYRVAYGLRPVGYPEIQVRDASKNGAPVCIDAFTVLR